MKTFNFVIPEPLRVRLEAESVRSGISLAEIVRRAIDEHLGRREGPPRGRSEASIEAAQESALARG